MSWLQMWHFSSIKLINSTLTLSIGSIKKSLKRYHCWCVTPWINHITHRCSKCPFPIHKHIRLHFLSEIIFTHLFPLMVGFSHFDMGYQVSTSTSIQDVRHRDHQVVQRSSLRLFSSAQLVTDHITSLQWHRNIYAATSSQNKESKSVFKSRNQMKTSPLLLQASCWSQDPDFYWWTSLEWEGSRRGADPRPECQRWSLPYCTAPPHCT